MCVYLFVACVLTLEGKFCGDRDVVFCVPKASTEPSTGKAPSICLVDEWMKFCQKSSWWRQGLGDSLKEAKEGVSGSRKNEYEMRKSGWSSEELPRVGSRMDRRSGGDRGPRRGLEQGAETKAQAQEPWHVADPSCPELWGAVTFPGCRRDPAPGLCT